MNGRTATTGILVCAVALFVAMQYGRAASQTAVPPASKIGLVSVRDVFNGSKKYAQYQVQRARRQGQASAQIDDLTKQVAKDEGELKVLKPGTGDYLKQLQVVLETRAKLQNQQELLKQQLMTEDKEWLEGLYQEALKITETLAKERGLELVLERTEPKFPMASEEVFSVISTHKVLYCGGCIDLTNDVITRVDASMNLKP